MSRVAALRREDVPELEEVFRRAEKALGSGGWRPDKHLRK